MVVTAGHGVKARRSKHTDKRATIRDEAARIFASRGYHGASVQEIADALGLNKASLYHYYRSKEQMLFDILSFADAEIAALLDADDRMTESPLGRIGQFVTTHVTWYLRHPAIAKVAFRDWNELTGDALATQMERRRRYSHVLRDAIEHCRALGLIPPEANIVLLANFINGAVAAANVWFNPDGADTPEAVGQAFGDMAIAVVMAAGRNSNQDMPGATPG